MNTASAGNIGGKTPTKKEESRQPFIGIHIGAIASNEIEAST